MNENNNDYVSLVRIPRKWFNAFVWVFSTLIIANTLAEFLLGWTWEALGETSLARMAVLMTLIVGWFFILSHIWEAIMLGHAKLFKEKVYAEGKAAGIAEGIAEGKAEGIAEEQKRLLSILEKKGVDAEIIREIKSQTSNGK